MRRDFVIVIALIYPSRLLHHVHTALNIARRVQQHPPLQRDRDSTYQPVIGVCSTLDRIIKRCCRCFESAERGQR